MLLHLICHQIESIMNPLSTTLNIAPMPALYSSLTSFDIHSLEFKINFFSSLILTPGEEEASRILPAFGFNTDSIDITLGISEGMSSSISSNQYM